MDNCVGIGLGLKRKEFDDADDEVFADFCLSSPACKIRRLDANFPPIIDQNAGGAPLRHEQAMPESGVPNQVTDQLNPLDIEELPFVPENNEKAIVLFKPMNNPLFHSPNMFSIDPNLISSFKNQAISHTHYIPIRPSEDADAYNNGELNGCKAIIPWVPSQSLDQRPVLASQTEEESGSMETEDMEVAMMEIEHSPPISEELQHQWLQQPHCMVVPPPAQNTTFPIVWHR